ncbi:MAG: hypothetical protein GF398_03930 [Chitinivibrionales bacterium]|nr:hypothetical protein [Chitinivibrionales bacterium]
MKNRNLLIIALSLAAVFTIISCAAQQPVSQVDAPGFWLGIWHGMIAPFAFIIGLFNDIRIYAFPNNGGWYDFGFLLGISIWGGGGAAAGRRHK